MNWLKQLNILVVVLGLGITAVLFQNCGQMTTITSSSSSSSNIPIDEWFDYPYTSKPAAYGEFHLFRPAANSGNDGLYTYEVIGSVAPSDNSGGYFNYTMTIKDSNGDTVCPTQTGADRSIRFTCIGLKLSSTIIVDLTINYAGTSTHVRKIF